MNAAKLYNAEVLGLAASLAEYPTSSMMPHHGFARAPTCGSTIEITLDTDPGCAITEIGVRAQACAIGQAAAAIFAQTAPGKTRDEIELAITEIETWLAGGTLPDWSGLAAIAAARDFPARHGAILLAWRAALVALTPPR